MFLPPAIFYCRICTDINAKIIAYTTTSRCEEVRNVPQYTGDQETGIAGKADLNKVIFLDVDGVLNNGVWAAGVYCQGIPMMGQLRAMGERWSKFARF